VEAAGPAGQDTGPARPAAGNSRREAALAAFARHPLVDSDVLAAKLLAGYEAAFPELQQLWHGGNHSKGGGS
jgi:6-phospho-beta-glucosidase